MACRAIDRRRLAFQIFNILQHLRIYRTHHRPHFTGDLLLRLVLGFPFFGDVTMGAIYAERSGIPHFHDSQETARRHLLEHLHVLEYLFGRLGFAPFYLLAQFGKGGRLVEGGRGGVGVTVAVCAITPSGLIANLAAPNTANAAIAKISAALRLILLLIFSLPSGLFPDVCKIERCRPRFALIGGALPMLANVAVRQLAEGYFSEGFDAVFDRVRNVDHLPFL